MVIGPASRAIAFRPARPPPVAEEGPDTTKSDVKSDVKSDAKSDQASTGEVDKTESTHFHGTLTVDETREVQQLRARDNEVRQHELAHAAVGGAHSGSPSYSYETGPDGRRYAVSGEVSIDTSEISGDSQASVAKLQQVVRAALAPAQPSGQDRSVAASAQAKIARIQAEGSEQPQETDEVLGRHGTQAYQRASAEEPPPSDVGVVA